MKEAVWTGRGAAALYAVLRARGLRGKLVLMPSILCPSPANAVLYSGNRPLFCDVDLKTFGLDENHLMRLLRRKDIGAAVLVHLYGYPFSNSFVEKLKAKKIFVIEDACQSFGGPSASGADCTVFSFGHSKIIDLGDGGAVVSNNRAFLAKVRREEARLSAKPAHFAPLASLYKKLYYNLMEAAALDERFHALFGRFPQLFKDLYLYRHSNGIPKALGGALGRLQKTLKTRRRFFEIYCSELGPAGIYFPDVPPDAAIWRATGLAPAAKKRNLILSRLRAKGIDVSSWYPSLHRWYEDPDRKPYRDSDFPNSLEFEGRVVNFWVDESVNEKKVRLICKETKKALRS